MRVYIICNDNILLRKYSWGRMRSFFGIRAIKIGSIILLKDLVEHGKEEINYGG